MQSTISVAALSDVGCVRTNNEDNFGYDPANDLYVVCDGMGGMAAGEVASSIACSTVIQVFGAQPADTPFETRMALAIRAANDAVVHNAQNPAHKGMGTTLVAAAVQGSKLLIGNVGDSRAYMLQNGACMQLTVDHSYINELIRMGSVKVEDVPHLDLKGYESVITRAIGASHDVEPDFFFVDLKENDTVLLSSDGLTRYIDVGILPELISPADLQGSCQRLIDAAKAAGGADNITCILIRYNAKAGAEVGTETAALPTEAAAPVAEASSPVTEAPAVPSFDELLS